MTKVTIPQVPSKRDGTKVWTPTFKGGFVSLLKAKSIPGTDQEPLYSIMMLFPDDADLKPMQEAVR